MKKLLGILKKAGIAFVSEGKTFDLLHTEGSFGEIGELSRAKTKKIRESLG